MLVHRALRESSERKKKPELHFEQFQSSTHIFIPLFITNAPRNETTIYYSKNAREKKNILRNTDTHADMQYMCFVKKISALMPLFRFIYIINEMKFHNHFASALREEKINENLNIQKTNNKNSHKLTMGVHCFISGSDELVYFPSLAPLLICRGFFLACRSHFAGVRYMKIIENFIQTHFFFSFFVFRFSFSLNCLQFNYQFLIEAYRALLLTNLH